MLRPSIIESPLPLFIQSGRQPARTLLSHDNRVSPKQINSKLARESMRLAALLKKEPANYGRVDHPLIAVGHAVSDVGHTVAGVGHALSYVGHDVTAVGHAVPAVNHAVTDVGHAVSAVGHALSYVGHTVTGVVHAVTAVGHTGPALGNMLSKYQKTVCVGLSVIYNNNSYQRRPRTLQKNQYINTELARQIN